MKGSSCSSVKSDQDYQAEDDYRTLTRANEVQSDKARMRGVAKHHAKAKKAFTAMDRSISGGRKF